MLYPIELAALDERQPAGFTQSGRRPSYRRIYAMDCIRQGEARESDRTNRGEETRNNDTLPVLYLSTVIAADDFAGLGTGEVDGAQGLAGGGAHRQVGFVGGDVNQARHMVGFEAMAMVAGRFRK
jgi:hypothetical protein